MADLVQINSEVASLPQAEVVNISPESLLKESEDLQKLNPKKVFIFPLIIISLLFSCSAVGYAYISKDTTVITIDPNAKPILINKNSGSKEKKEEAIVEGTTENKAIEEKKEEVVVEGTTENKAIEEKKEEAVVDDTTENKAIEEKKEEAIAAPRSVEKDSSMLIGSIKIRRR